VPESRRRKKRSPNPRPERHEAAPDAPSGRWVPVTGSALLIVGLLWIVVYYVAGADIPGISTLGNWNLMVGMGLIVAGFLVFTRWK
jgi:hypothetical protein